MLNITTRNEQMLVTQWVIMLYGQPGTGKTSIAFTAEKPLLLDFDQGAYRSDFRKDVVQISSWADVEGMTDDDLKPYKTICVDTTGRMLDHLASALVKENSKWGTRAGGLTLQGYGVMKNRFSEWIKMLKLTGLNVLLLAHEKEERNGDEIRIRPDIQGGSFGEVFKVADQVGYMFSDQNGKTVIDFNPCESHYGKNTGQIERQVVPNFHAEPDYLENLGQSMLDKVNTLSEESKKFADDVDFLKKGIEEIQFTQDLDKATEDMKAMDEGPLRIMARHLISFQAKKCGFKFNKELGVFEIEESEEDENE